MRVYEYSVRWSSGEKEFKSSLTDVWNAVVAFVAAAAVVAVVAAVALSRSVCSHISNLFFVVMPEQKSRWDFS